MKQRHECDICDGSGSIRLPVIRRTPSRVQDADFSAELQRDTSRTYECPECTLRAPGDERVQILERFHEIRDHMWSEPDAKTAVMKNAAHDMADAILRTGFMRFQVRKCGEPGLVAIRATIGVVSTNRVATIERRAFDKARTILSGALRYATTAIRHWGSHYGAETINKSQAIDYMEAGLKRHIQETEAELDK